MAKRKKTDDEKIFDGIRGAWFYSQVRRDAKKACLTLDGVTGEPVKTPQGDQLYDCAECAGTTVNIKMDHIKPMMPLTGLDNWIDLIARTMDPKNHQGLCKRCHDKKSRAENAQRKKHAKA